MKGLLKLAFIGGLGAMLYKSFKGGDGSLADDRGPIGSSGVVRDAGLGDQRDPPRDWDMVDEQSDESFPASDPPGNY